MKREDNRGFTLIELIVVIAIMSVLMAASALSLTLISRQRVSNAATSTKQMLQLAQTYARSKNVCFVRAVGTDDGGANFDVFTRDTASPVGKEKYGNGPAEVHKQISTTVVYSPKEKLGDETAEIPVELTAGQTIDIEFERSTGGFKLVTIPDGSGAEGYPVKIKFSNGSKTAILYLATWTGVITYETEIN